MAVVNLVTQPGGHPSESPSEDAIAVEVLHRHAGSFLYVRPWARWMRWDGKRWRADSTGKIYHEIRLLVREYVKDRKAERSTATAGFVGGVERLLRHDQVIAALPEDFDADPWLLNTQGGIVDLRTGDMRPHDSEAMCTHITNVEVDPNEGYELWRQFLDDITLGDFELQDYLQRVVGYCATGVTTEDILVFLLGVGANGKSSFVEAVMHALGDYARQFAPEVLMEAKGERHPTEIAQFMGVRMAATGEPPAHAVWNDSRVKSMTGDATLSARVMRGDPFEFKRTHKTVVSGNHLPRMGDLSHGMRRRMQVVPFRAVFTQQQTGESMRERLKAECGGAVLSWIVSGARKWSQTGTAPPTAVTDLTADYLADQDVLGQWLDEACERGSKSSERSSALHRSYSTWCERQGLRPESAVRLSAQLAAMGFVKKKTAVGKLFYGLRLKPVAAASE